MLLRNPAGSARLFTMATAPRRFFRCACFCSENLYVARYGLHVRFRNEEQLRQDYGPVSGLHRLRGARAGRGLCPGAVGFARGPLRACCDLTTRMTSPLGASVFSP